MQIVELHLRRGEMKRTEEGLVLQTDRVFHVRRDVADQRDDTRDADRPEKGRQERKQEEWRVAGREDEYRG